MYTSKAVTTAPLVHDRSGYYEVMLGTVDDQHLNAVNAALSRVKLKHALRTESKLGGWCDTDVSASNFNSKFFEPAVSVRSLTLNDQGLSALFKPVGPNSEQLRARLEAGTPVTIHSFIDEREVCLFVAKWW